MNNKLKSATATLAVTLFLSGCSTMTDLKQRFAPCPKSPNCVSSLADSQDETHYIDALKSGQSKEEAKSRIKKILEQTPRVSIVVDEPDYIHAVFTTLIMRYKDDVEFKFEEEGTIQVRSASRVGYSDLGANRKRIEAIREQL